MRVKRKRWCEYGCGLEAHYQLKNGKWCCSKSWNSCPVLKKKNKRMLGKRHTEEVRRKMSEARIGRHFSEETKRRMRENHADMKGEKAPWYGRPRSEETRRKIGEGNKGKVRSKKTKKKLSEILTGRKLTEETKKKIGKASIGRFYSKATREKMSLSQRFLWQDVERRKKQSKRSKGLWQDLEYVKKVQQGLHLQPNKPERVLLNLLNRLYPNEWKYTGDLSFMISGKSPDFTNVNGQKKLIELFGDYFHSQEVIGVPEKQHEQERKKLFKSFGWDTLVIWEQELENISKVTFRINRFVRERKRAYI